MISDSGKELIKVSNGKLIDQAYLKDVSKLENTTYLSETYFDDTRQDQNDIFVSSLVSWYISRQEQLDLDKDFDGVIVLIKEL